MTVDMIHYIEWIVLQAYVWTHNNHFFLNCTDLASLCSSVSCSVLCLLLLLLLLNFSLLSITVHMLISLLRLEFSNDFNINCGVSRFLLDFFFVYLMYVSFLLPAWGFLVTSGFFCVQNVQTISTTSVGLSGFFRTFFAYETYEQFLLTSVGFSGFVQEIFGHMTYEPLLPIILGLAQARPNYSYIPGSYCIIKSLLYIT